MALYTKQQLIDAYCASTGCGSSNPELTAEVIRVQAEIDAELSILVARKERLIAVGTEKLNAVQSEIDSIEPNARESMKNVAFEYIWSQDNAQDEIDSDGVSL